MKLLNEYAKKALDVQFTLNSSTPGRIYTNDSRTVRGTVSIKVLKQVKKVTKLDLGFRGTIVNNFRHVHITYTATVSGGSTRVREHCQKLELFDDVNTVDEFDVPQDLNVGDEIIREFQFEFPVSQELPSSVEVLGGQADNQGNTTITYELYVRIHHKEDLFRVGPLEFEQPVLFQGASVAYSRKVMKTVEVMHIFEKKLKKKIWDAKRGQLVTSPIAKPRKHTRVIRKLWNDNYKPEKFETLAKDVPLSCQFTFAETFNLHEPLRNLVKLRLVVPSSITESALQRGGISTGLGEFAIVGFDMNVLHCVMNSTDGFKYRFHSRRRLFSSKTDMQVDVKDFGRDKRTGNWAMNIPMEDLIGPQAHIPLIGQLVKPVLCSYDMPPLLHNETSIIIKVLISNTEPDSPKVIEYNVEVPAEVTDYTETLPAYTEEETPPPSFTMSQ